MNKKKRILIAGLMAISVTGASTFAYFTDSTSISGDAPDNPISLSITNGKIEVSARPGKNAANPVWSYDIVRKSSTGDEDIDRSPDIDLNGATTGKGWVNGVIDTTGEGTVGSLGTVKRVTIGTPVTGEILNARPGDSFVMGRAVAGGSDAGDDTGLVIDNTSSTLTAKVQLKVTEDSASGGYTLFKKLTDAGWKMYIDGNEIVATDQSTLESNLASALHDKAVIAPLKTAKFDIRLELPLSADNTYQNDSALGHIGVVEGFDLNKLFTIIATQENNPGWDE